MRGNEKIGNVPVQWGVPVGVRKLMVTGARRARPLRNGAHGPTWIIMNGHTELRLSLYHTVVLSLRSLAGLSDEQNCRVGAGTKSCIHIGGDVQVAIVWALSHLPNIRTETVALINWTRRYAAL